VSGSTPEDRAAAAARAGHAQTVPSPRSPTVSER